MQLALQPRLVAAAAVASMQVSLLDADFEAAWASAGAESLAQMVVWVLRSEFQQVAVQPSTPAVQVKPRCKSGTRCSGEGRAAAALMATNMV